MHYLKRRSIQLLMITLGLDALFFGTSNPARVSPLWLIVGFVLVILTLHWLIRAVVAFVGLYVQVVRRQKRQLSIALTAVAGILVGLQSMGQLSLKDFLVLTPLIVLGYFYVRYNRRSTLPN